MNYTIQQNLTDLISHLNKKREDASDSIEARDISIAITHLEDALFRLKKSGVE